MSWEKQTLDVLRTKTEKKLRSLRESRGWTPEGPWKLCLEMNSSKPLRDQMQVEEYEDSTSSDSDSTDEEQPTYDTSLLRQSRNDSLRNSSSLRSRGSWRSASLVYEPNIEPSRLDLMEETPWSRPHLNSDGDPISSDHTFAWLQYMRFFRWGQLDLIAERFHQEVTVAGVNEEGLDTISCVREESLREITADCLEMCFNIRSINDECDVVSFAVDDIRNRDNMYSFLDIVRCVALTVAIYQDTHDTAGFDYHERRHIEDVFEGLVGEGVRSVRPTKVFAILSCLGIETETMADQKNVIRLCGDVDQDRSGTIDYIEFLHLFRRLRRDCDYSRRNNELRGIVSSGLANDEVDGFRRIFELASSDYGDHTAIPVKDMLDQFRKLNVTFTRSDRLQVCTWVDMVDIDRSGTLDFGEFCCLMRLIWETNLGNVKKMAETKATEMATGGQEAEPNMARRMSREVLREDKTSWVTLMVEAQALEQYESFSKSGFKMAFGKALDELDTEESQEGSRRPSRVRFANAQPNMRRRGSKDLSALGLPNMADGMALAPSRKMLNKVIHTPAKPRRMAQHLMEMCANIGDAPSMETMMQIDKPSPKTKNADGKPQQLGASTSARAGRVSISVEPPSFR